MNEVIALLPAHNEGETINQAIDGLRAQTMPPTRIIVIPDNCTDDTEALALAAGVDVQPTAGNTDKKAGALNQALAALLPTLADDDVVLVQDADSALDPTFIENAMIKLADPAYGAVGGVFRGDDRPGFVAHLQRNEYARYARDVARLKGRCLVVTGTAALFRVKTLREIVQGRADGTLPPGIPTERNEMPKKYTDEEREIIFWSRFREADNGCLEWTGRLHADGYGEFDVPRRPGRNVSVLTHRQAWEYTWGSIPEGLYVRHTCDNPKCGNPDHLLLGTQTDNMQDMVSRGRKPSRKGELNGRAKLTQSDVDTIRATYVKKYGNLRRMADEYGVSPTTIKNIVNGKLWPIDGQRGDDAQVAPGVYDTTVLTED